MADIDIHVAFLCCYCSRDPQHQLALGYRNESVEDILQRKYRTYFNRKSNCLIDINLVMMTCALWTKITWTMVQEDRKY